MTDVKISLENKERFLNLYKISKDKLIEAAQKATDKLLRIHKINGNGFPGTCSVNYKYKLFDETNWESGMYTGCFWLAYQLTGEKVYRDIAESHLSIYKRNLVEKVGIHDHDVGFTYSPSCVAAYKITGNEWARKIALEAADFFYTHSYSKNGKFIIRSYSVWEDGTGCRTMMDSLMNAPFLFWASKESGNTDYYEAAYQQQITTKELLIRNDGSSFHHYQFDPKTAKPLYGLTFQGHGDSSCWSRGHSWGVYGFPIAYSYTKDTKIRNVQRAVTNFMLNNLPSNAIPYWDYDFKEPSEEPRDSSSCVISACGMMEMARLIEDNTQEKEIYQTAAAMLLDSVIDNCTGDIGVEYDGLINHVTHALPQGQGIDECAVYGDYFYLEALMRFINPDWEMYW